VSAAAGSVVKWLGSRPVVWLLLAAPGAYWLQAYWREVLFYGEVVHLTGVFAVQLMLVTLALTPLRRVMPRARWLGWLRRRRRNLGVAAFAYAWLHALVYLFVQQYRESIIADLPDAWMWTGWLGIVLMSLLAATSNDRSLRGLGSRRWQSLHRTVYAVAALSIAHWVLSAFDPTTGYVTLAVLVAIEALRLPGLRRRATG
jgi:sulfoxide reductase heme-binding subunit YedZ